MLDEEKKKLRNSLRRKYRLRMRHVAHALEQMEGVCSDLLELKGSIYKADEIEKMLSAIKQFKQQTNLPCYNDLLPSIPMDIDIAAVLEGGMTYDEILNKHEEYARNQGFNDMSEFLESLEKQLSADEAKDSED